MVDQTLKQTMDKEWHKVRRGFHYPQLPAPQLVDDIPNGAINMVSLETLVSEPFIRGFEPHGITPEESLNEVLTHETTHFMHYPGSVVNMLRLQKAARGIVDPQQASTLRTDFTEAQTNLFMLQKKNHPATARMRRVYQPDPQDATGRLMYGLYQTVSGQDFGVTLTPEESTMVRNLAQIDFLDKGSELDNFRRFATILKDYRPSPQQQNQQNSNGKGAGQSQPSDSPGAQGKPSGQFDKQGNVTMFSNSQIREGLRQFAQECPNPKEFEDIARQVLGEDKRYEEALKRASEQSGLRPGTDAGVLLLADNIYSALADKHAIPIRKKPMERSGTMFPHSRVGFSIGDPIHEIDPYSTPGILPGITKKIVWREGESYGELEHTPSNMLLIDNSPSMFSPNGSAIVSPSDRVYPHIVGATAIANAYLDNGTRVGVYSFGSNDHLTNFSRSKPEVHAALRRFSKDGGTTFNPALLEGLLAQKNGDLDVTVVSDMGISNLDNFIGSVLALPRTHRVHLFYTSKHPDLKPYVDKLRTSFGTQENVAIMPLTSPSDIYAITMGELKKSVH